MTDYYLNLCATGNAVLPLAVAFRVKGLLRLPFILIGLVHFLEFWAGPRSFDSWVFAARCEYVLLSVIAASVLIDYSEFPVCRQRAQTWIYSLSVLWLIFVLLDKYYIRFERWDQYIAYVAFPFMVMFLILPVLKIRNEVLTSVSCYGFMTLVLMFKVFIPYRLAWELMTYVDPLVLPTFCLIAIWRLTGIENGHKQL